MSGVPFEQLREIVLAAAELDEPERSEYLANVCRDDAALLEQAKKLLAVDPSAMADLEAGLGEWTTSLALEPTTSFPSPGEYLGPYRLDVILGSGGSGTVFEAHQEEPVRRKVAVKILHHNRPLSADFARFQAEKEILALLNHPHIAKVHDAGTTNSGAPFIVMELVSGEPITTFAESADLTRRERIDLCLEACRAAEHAHGKGVIHRDLKPNNILVSLVDGRPMVKVIDFGIARPLETGNHQGLTLDGAHLGTPEYMSPEQATGRSEAIDVKTDVHALGNLLQEMLCGYGVYDPDGKSIASQLQMVASGNRRLADQEVQGHRLPSDLRTIIAKATDPDPDQRYRTAEALAEDLERFLAQMPILARKAGLWYLTRKAAVRHPVASTLFVILNVVVLAFIMILVDSNAKQREAAAEARLEAARTAKLASYLQGMFEAASPDGLGRDATMSEVLDDALRRAEIEFATEPMIEGMILKTLAEVESSLDRNESALSTVDKAIETLEARGPADPTQYASLQLTKAGILVGMGDTEGAETILRSVLEQIQGKPGLSPLEARAWIQLGNLTALYGNYAEGDASALNALAAIHPDQPDYRDLSARAVITRSNCLVNLGQPDLAGQLLREELTASEMEFGPDHPTTVRLLNNLAYVASVSGDAEENLRIMRQVVERSLRLFRPDHIYLATFQNNLASSMLQNGLPHEALPHMERAHLLWSHRYGDVHPYMVSANHNLGRILHLLGELEPAADHLAEAIRVADELGGESWNDYSILLIANLASTRLAQGQLAEAERLVRGCLAKNSIQTEETRANVAWAYYTLGSVLLEAGKPEQAILQFRQADLINGRQKPPSASLQALTDNGMGCSLAGVDWERARECLDASEEWLLGDHRTLHRRLPALGRTAALLEGMGDTKRAALYEDLALALTPVRTEAAPDG